MQSKKSNNGIVTQSFTFAESPNELKLDCGTKLGPITLTYEIYGQLNANKDNAVLVFHALSGDSHAACLDPQNCDQPGWWDNLIGPGKAINTEKYFVICANVIGGCKGSTGPLSINPETGKPYGLSFPVITIADMVKAQSCLIDHLKIETLLAVIGGSMGGMLAMKWAVLFPERAKAIIPIAASLRLTPQAIAFDAVGRNAIISDNDWSNGNYYEIKTPSKGLSVARMIGHITYLSHEGMHQKFGRRLQGSDKYHYDFDSEFEVETYLDYQGKKFVERFDANSYLYITKAIDYFDLPGKYGQVEKAFEKTKGRFLVISFSTDWLFPPYQSREIVSALTRTGKDVTYCNIESSYGHDAFLLDQKTLPVLVSGFLDQTKELHDLPVASDKDSELYKSDIPNIFSGPRVDYDRIISLVAAGSKVLDLGCGNGELLARVREKKEVTGTGIEISEELLSKCVGRGVTAIQTDLDEGLSLFNDKTFDVAILSQTLQVIQRPDLVLNEMLRVARCGIVSFPNFAYWRARLQLGIKGKAPVVRSLPYRWYNSPNIHFLSIRDFERFCRQEKIKIEKRYPLSTKTNLLIRLFPNLFAQEAVYVLTKT
ncbi:MAG: homoserine O-acetyltransferase [Candidatus Theseobacter exili]|nr:homoserine O-acetyltransferase [Candidatus Theseobacter exili]